MNRRSFFRALGQFAALSVVAPLDLLTAPPLREVTADQIRWTIRAPVRCTVEMIDRDGAIWFVIPNVPVTYPRFVGCLESL